MSNKFYCPAPFNSIRVDATAGGASMRPCCAYVPRERYDSVGKYLQSRELEELRQQFLSDNDRFPPGCIRCQQQEHLNHPSLRTHFNNKFKDRNNQNIVQLEIFPGNICNLKCFMCNPDDSTALASEYKKIGWISEYKEINNADIVLHVIEALPDVEGIHFIGGEFFLTKRNLAILDSAIKHNLSVSISTNATTLLPEHLERLANINDLEISVSVDGINDSYEFMRYPAKWSTVEKNIKNIKNILPRARIIGNFVVQILNLQYLVPTIAHLNQMVIPMHLTNIVSPRWLAWNVLTKKEATSLMYCIKQQLSTYKLTTKQKYAVEQYVNMLESTETETLHRETFISNMSKIMKVRKIEHSIIRQHFGILSDLADVICNSYRVKKANA